MAKRTKHDRDFAAVTARYLAWASTYCSLDTKALKQKRKKMAASALAFLRGTFYRWNDYFAAASDKIRSAPEILSIGDIHLENFGTWRDAEGRLVWGVNDFDEAATLPFTSDLLRICVSAALEAERDKFHVTAKEAVESILQGYRLRLADVPTPYVLEERHGWLRDLAAADGRSAADDWQTMQAERRLSAKDIASRPRRILTASLPQGCSNLRYFARSAGLGSLGRPRYMVAADWRGGLVAREVKAALPSAVHMPRTDMTDLTRDYRRALKAARCVPDPMLILKQRWILRRLSPEARKVEVDEIEKVRDQRHLLHAMGQEVANVHLGTAGSAKRLRKYLKKIPESSLLEAVKQLSRYVRDDFRKFRKDNEGRAAR